MEDQEDRRRFQLSFSSEEPYDRWFGPEILSHKDGEVDLSRLNDMGVLLFNHSRDKVVGKIIRAWVENKKGMAEVEFDDDEFSETIRKKVDCGTLKGVSVGYMVTRWEDVAENHQSQDGFAGPCSIARAWIPYEVSIAPVPADPTVGVGRDIDGEIPGYLEALAIPPERRGGMSLREAEKQIMRNEKWNGGNQ